MSCERFKLGFLKRCSALGMTPGESRQVALSALTLLNGVLEKQAGGALDALQNLGMIGGGLAIAAPPILGGAVGYGLGRLADVGDLDVDEAKTREKIDELQRLAIKARHNRAMQLATQAMPAPRPLF